MVAAPVAMARSVTSRAPRISPLTNGDCRVTHREYIADVLGTVAYGYASRPVNPGQAEVFPWLSQIAQRFENYRFNSLRFLLEPLCGTTSTGSVILALDFDSADGPPLSKVEAMSFRASARGAPWEEMQISAQSVDLHKLPQHFVSSTNFLAANLDVKMYNVANLIVATQGQASTAPVSELYVEYDVTLLTPQMNTGSASSFVYSTTAVSAANGFGIAPVFGAGNTLPIEVAGDGSYLRFLAPFVGLWCARIAGTAITSLAATGSTATVTPIAASSGTTVGNWITQFAVRAAAGEIIKMVSTASAYVGAYHLFTPTRLDVLNP